MPSRHKSPLIGWHPPADLSAWIRAEAERREVTVSVILNEAVEAKRAAESKSDAWGEPELSRPCPTCSAPAGEDCRGFGYCASRASGSIEEAAAVVSRYELDQLLAVATMYVDAFRDDELMTLPQKLALQDMDAILDKYGRRY